MSQAIARSDWARVCEQISELLEKSEACIEVMSPGVGHQVVSDWRPWLGISYDPEDDLIDIALDGGVDHMVQHPQGLSTDAGLGDLHAIEITGGDGLQHIVRLRDQPALPG
jgi:hypothetical protein